MFWYTKFSCKASSVLQFSKRERDIFVVEVNKWDGNLLSGSDFWIIPIPEGITSSILTSEEELLEIVGLTNLREYYNQYYSILIIKIRIVEFGSPRLVKIFSSGSIIAPWNEVFIGQKTIIKKKEDTVPFVDNVYLLVHTVIGLNKPVQFSKNWVKETSTSVREAKEINNPDYIFFKGLLVSDWSWDDYLNMPRWKVYGVIRTVYLIRKC